MNNITENRLTGEEKHKREAECRRKKLGIYLIGSLKAMKKTPLKILAPALIAIAFVLCWLNRDAIFSVFPINLAIFPNIIAAIFTYTLYIVMIALFVLIFLICLKTIGTPRHSRRIEKGLMEIFRNSVSYGRAPIFVSREQKGTVSKLTFFSEWVSRDTWIEKRSNIAHLLRGHIVGEIAHGGKESNDPRYIVIHIGQGATPVEREAPQDPLFRK